MQTSKKFLFIAKYDCTTCVAVFLQLQIHLLVLFFGIVLDIPIGFSKRAICQCKCLQVPRSRRWFTTPPTKDNKTLIQINIFIEMKIFYCQIFQTIKRRLKNNINIHLHSWFYQY